MQNKRFLTEFTTLHADGVYTERSRSTDLADYADFADFFSPSQYCTDARFEVPAWRLYDDDAVFQLYRRDVRVSGSNIKTTPAAADLALRESMTMSSML